MKQLDFFFDYFSQLRSQLRGQLLSKEEKTLVAGGKRELSEVLFVQGRKIFIRRRAYQRNLSLTAKADGTLIVTAARKIPIKMITKFVSDSWVWVGARREYYAELQRRFPEKKFEPNEDFPILDKKYSLQINFTAARKAQVKLENGQLIVDVPQYPARHNYRHQVRLAVRSYYEQLGKQILQERVHYYSQKLQLYPQSLSFRCQKTRWGSCSQSGHISLNWRLVAAPIEVLDYVVVHELCHLKHLNHSKNFWGLVETHCANWKMIRKWLSENRYAFDFLMDISELHPGSSRGT